MSQSPRLLLRLRCAGVISVAIVMLAAGVPVAAKSDPPASTTAGRRPLQRQDVYLPSVTHWDRPVDAGDGARSHLEVAVFYPWGEFVGGRVTVTRQAHGKLMVLPEEDFALRRGSWKRKGKDVMVESKWLKYEQAEGARKKGKTVKEVWATDPRDDKALSQYIMIGGTEYMQAQALANPETLESMFNRPLEDPKKAKKAKKTKQP